MLSSAWATPPDTAMLNADANSSPARDAGIDFLLLVPALGG
jgi:hypothetical protein